MNTEIKKSIETLESGDLLLYPTDTVWGLGCDATNEEAVKKVYALKERAESKSLVILVNSLEMLNEYIKHIPEEALRLLNSLEKPTTIIYEHKQGLAKNMIAADNTIAVRIPNHQFCQDLITEFGKPIVSTSANKSGKDTPKSFPEIDKAIIEGVDYVVNLERDRVSHKASTILKLVGDEIEVIRA
jgi:L-threonylcarbamoyladenylate synthase